jgi:hypothetical protein
MSSAAGPNPRPVWQIQFGLRTLLLSVTLIGTVLAIAKAVGPLGAIGVGFVLMLVLLHVAGNAIGTRLRDDATRQLASDSANQPPHGKSAEAASLDAGRLGERTPLGLLIVVLTALGVGLGTFAGWLVFGRQPTLAGAIVGTCSAAVLGGFFGFLSSSFAKNMLAAWWEAKQL